MRAFSHDVKQKETLPGQQRLVKVFETVLWFLTFQKQTPGASD